MFETPTFIWSRYYFVKIKNKTTLLFFILLEIKFTNKVIFLFLILLATKFTKLIWLT